MSGYTKKPAFKKNNSYDNNGSSSFSSRNPTVKPDPNSWGAFEHASEPWKQQQSTRVRSFPNSKTAYDPESSAFDSSAGSNDGWITKTNPQKRDGMKNTAGSTSSFDKKEFSQTLQKVTPRFDDKMYAELGLQPDVFKTEPELEVLNHEQSEVIKSILLAGLSVFFSGPAGTGKSRILAVLEHLNSMCETPKKIVLTATTGIAA
jgi:hypothetical protein